MSGIDAPFRIYPDDLSNAIILHRRSDDCSRTAPSRTNF
jgi:hypothetical protein